jgi:hypothetical protein
MSNLIVGLTGKNVRLILDSPEIRAVEGKLTNTGADAFHVEGAKVFPKEGEMTRCGTYIGKTQDISSVLVLEEEEGDPDPLEEVVASLGEEEDEPEEEYDEDDDEDDDEDF